MDLKRLRTFVTVADQGTVSSAANKLRITQPALSRQLQDLQAEFGVALFSQVGRRLRLTAEGIELLPECRDLLSHADAVAERAQSLAHGDRGVLRIGATPHVIANFFPGFLRKFSVKYPNVRLQAVEGGGLELVEALRRGDVHAAFAATEGSESDFTIYPLPAAGVLAAYRPGPGLALATPVEVHALAQHPLLLLTSAFGSRKTFDAACRLARITPEIFMESAATETLLSLARDGLGIAIVPTTAPMAGGKLRLVPVAYRGIPLSIPVAVLWSRQHHRPRYADDLGATFAEHMQSISPKFEQAIIAGPRARRPSTG